MLLPNHWQEDLADLLNPKRATRIPYRFGLKYAMLAAINPMKWRSTPRDIYGYPQPASLIKREEKRAWQLVKVVRAHAEAKGDPRAYISDNDDACIPLADVRAFANYFHGKIIVHRFPPIEPPSVVGEGGIVAVIGYCVEGLRLIPRQL